MKLKFKICISAFVLFCKRKPYTNFHQKYWYLSPLEFFWKWKLWPTCTGIRSRRNFGFGLLKSCLTLGYLTCSVRSKKIPHSTLIFMSQIKKNWWILLHMWQSSHIKKIPVTLKLIFFANPFLLIQRKIAKKGNSKVIFFEFF